MTFEKATEAINSSGQDKNVKMTDDEHLQLYSLYKQSTTGDLNSERPGILDFKGKAKWDSWERQRGKTQQNARNEYIALAKSLLTKYGKNDLIDF